MVAFITPCVASLYTAKFEYMKSEIRAVLFDLDDTLLKTAQIKWAHHKAVAAQYDIDLTDETLARYWGMPFDQMIGYLYDHVDTVENMRAANRVLEPQFPKEIHDDTLTVLSMLALHGIVAGVVTSTNTEFAVADLQRLHVPDAAFLFVQGAEATSYHKPDGRVFDSALARLAGRGIRPSEVLYVGDALIDYQAAAHAGIQFVGVATGFVSIEQFQEAGASAIPHLGELPAFLRLET